MDDDYKAPKTYWDQNYEIPQDGWWLVGPTWDYPDNTELRTGWAVIWYHAKFNPCYQDRQLPANWHVICNG